MSLELPVLRLGLAGFPAAAQERLRQALDRLAGGAIVWEIASFDEADAWWINGARTQQLEDGTLRIASGVPAGRSLQLALAEVDRPVAFALPLPRGFTPALSFDPELLPSMAAALAQFESRLRPLVAQFGLAAQILEHETALGPGTYHVSAAGRLLAIVNLQGDAAVLTTAGPTDFDDAMWVARPASDAPLPPGFARTTMSHLMWQYALRTGRDVLPARDRSCTLYFRRPPRLPQRLLRDTHLLLMRELALAPGSFEDLARRTGLPDALLARELGALYLVGSITSNPKRAAQGWSASSARREAADSGLSHSRVPAEPGQASLRPAARKPPRAADMTAPAPISME